jgi:hypothetical protein
MLLSDAQQLAALSAVVRPECGQPGPEMSRPWPAEPCVSGSCPRTRLLWLQQRVRVCCLPGTRCNMSSSQLSKMPPHDYYVVRGDDRRCRRWSGARNVPSVGRGRGLCLTRTPGQAAYSDDVRPEVEWWAQHEGLARRLQQYGVTLLWLDRTKESVLFRSGSG